MHNKWNQNPMQSPDSNDNNAAADNNDDNDNSDATENDTNHDDGATLKSHQYQHYSPTRLLK